MAGNEMAGATNGAVVIPFHLVDIPIDGCFANGSFGKIWRGKMVEEGGLNPTTVAFKQLRGGTNDAFDKEVSTMRALDHRNILKLLGETRNPQGVRYMVFEYMVNGSLDHWLDQMGRTFGVVGANWDINHLSLLDIGFQIAEGMVHMEKKGIVHRDLAARNILLAENLRAKISDFGLSRNIDEEGYYTMRGSSVYPLRWTAPESFKKRVFNSKSDVWSFGVLLWEIFSYGSIPYGDLTSDEQVKACVNRGEKLKRPDRCPEEVYELMEDCWHLDTKERPSFKVIFKKISSVIKEMLIKPFLYQYINWDDNAKSVLLQHQTWNINQLPDDLRLRWGITNWPISELLIDWMKDIN